MYKPTIRVKFIWRLYRVKNRIKQSEGRTLEFRDMVEEALSDYLYWKEVGLSMSPRELPEAKLDGCGSTLTIGYMSAARFQRLRSALMTDRSR